MEKSSRIIGKYETGNPGALLFITAGIHGNEPAGVLALENVFKILQKEKPEIKGKIIGLKGNQKALKKQVRFIDEDLNRTWISENINSQKINTSEKEEMFEIIEILKSQAEKNFSKYYFLDCHTTSSKSEPYISVQNVNDNLKWAKLFPTHIICGFSDIVKGSIDRYESKIGMTGFTFEGGQHQEKSSIKNHEGIIWLNIQQACHLDFNDLNEIPSSVKTLLARRKNQKIFEIIYRHKINNNDDFKMKSGFKNFQKLKKGELLAHQNQQPIYSKWENYIFMPSYQSQGNDGFFIIKKLN